MTTYKTEDLIGGDIKTSQVKLAADTYYRGMPLEYDSNNDRYKYTSTYSNIAAIFLEDDSRAVSANGWASVIVGGEIQEGGLVDDSNSALTVTEDMIANFAANGFYIKRS